MLSLIPMFTTRLGVVAVAQDDPTTCLGSRSD